MKMDENLSSYLYILQMCLKCTTFVCKNYELMKIEFHTIFIINLLNAKFMMITNMTLG